MALSYRIFTSLSLSLGRREIILVDLESSHFKRKQGDEKSTYSALFDLITPSNLSIQAYFAPSLHVYAHHFVLEIV